MATIINGKEVSAKVKEQVAEEVKQLKNLFPPAPV